MSDVKSTDELKSDVANHAIKKSLVDRTIKVAINKIKKWLGVHTDKYPLHTVKKPESPVVSYRKIDGSKSNFEEDVEKRVNRIEEGLNNRTEADIDKNIHKNSHFPLRGIKNYLAAEYSSYRKKMDADKDIYPIKVHAQALSNLCNKPGDAVILNFNGGSHSALIVFDQELEEAVYLSYGRMGGFKAEGGGIKEICSDLWDFKDLVDVDNIVKLEGVNTPLILSEWRSSVKIENFHPLSNNCSNVAKKMLIAGTHNKLKGKKLKHDKFMQMPSNTHCLALEIQSVVRKKSRLFMDAG